MVRGRTWPTVAPRAELIGNSVDSSRSSLPNPVPISRHPLHWGLVHKETSSSLNTRTVLRLYNDVVSTTGGHVISRAPMSDIHARYRRHCFNFECCFSVLREGGSSSRLRRFCVFRFPFSSSCFIPSLCFSFPFTYFSYIPLLFVLYTFSVLFLSFSYIRITFLSFNKLIYLRLR